MRAKLLGRTAGVSKSSRCGLAPSLNGWLSSWPLSSPQALGRRNSPGRTETVLLPKGGTADPLDRRPITLLPMLYRIWAALRATQLRDWMRSAGIPSLVAGNRGTMASAEHQGLLLGLELEEARAFDDSLAGVAVDWSKRYDHLALHYVDDNLLATGVPAWFSGPLLSMYRAPRHIKVDGAIGAPRT